MVKGAPNLSTSKLLCNLCGYTLIVAQRLMDEGGRRGELPELIFVAK